MHIWARPTIMRKKAPYFIVPHLLAFRDIKYASDEEGTFAHLIIEFDAVYTPTKDPNELEMSILNVNCYATNDWPNDFDNYEAEADVELRSEDWEKLLLHVGQMFPPELKDMTPARFCHFGGIKHVTSIHEEQGNLIHMVKILKEKQRK